MTSRPKRKRVREPWGEFEDLALKEFYPRHGPRWDGWDEVLPSRTNHAISLRAQKLGLRAPIIRSKRNVEDDDEDEGNRMQPIEYERTVTKLMMEGLSPTAIDKRMHWIPGQTVSILKERWRKDNDN